MMKVKTGNVCAAKYKQALVTPIRVVIKNPKVFP